MHWARGDRTGGGEGEGEGRGDVWRGSGGGQGVEILVHERESSELLLREQINTFQNVIITLILKIGIHFRNQIV